MSEEKAPEIKQQESEAKEKESPSESTPKESPSEPKPESSKIQVKETKEPSPSPKQEEDPRLSEILELGFDDFITNLALKRTKGKDLDAAVNWIIDHSNQSDLESEAEDEDSEDEEDKLSEEQIKEIMGGK